MEILNSCKFKSLGLVKTMRAELNVDQIKKLWILDLIIQSGSLKGAAARAKVSPSAISQTLTSLEKNVGKPLIVRDRGSIAATEEALSILQVVRPAFDVFERLNNLGSQPVPQLAWLNFGTYESIAVSILPGLIHRLREKLPLLKLNVHISRTSQLINMVRKGELCSALITEVDDLDRLRIQQVANENLGFFVAKRHAGLGWAAIKKLGFGSLAPGKQGHPRYYSKFLKQTAEKPKILSDSFEALRCASAAGAIASILPSRVAYRSDDLVEIFPENKQPKVRLGMHKILLVSPSNCDPEEADFLAAETSALLSIAKDL